MHVQVVVLLRFTSRRVRDWAYDWFLKGKHGKRRLMRKKVKALLGRYLKVQPERVRFCNCARRKLALAALFGEHGVHFKVSHSHDMALCAKARNRKVGIDLAFYCPIPKIGDIVQRCLSSCERAVLRVLSPEIYDLGFFFSGWTCKEAYVNATGNGLRLAPDRFDVAIAPENPLDS